MCGRAARRTPLPHSDHNPRKLDDIPALLLEWEGEEDVLLANVEAKYLRVTTVMIGPLDWLRFTYIYVLRC